MLFAIGAIGLTLLLLSGLPQRGLAPPWWVLAAMATMFLAFSVGVVVAEGPFGVVAEHTRTFWSTQIWFDLLLAACTGWFAWLPRARAVGMRLPLWAILIVATGSIGLLAMSARIVFLEQRAERATAT